MEVLGALDAAGYDVRKLRYSLHLDEQYVLPLGQDDWHIDQLVELPIRQDVLRGASKVHVIHSNICSTITLPVNLMPAFPEFPDQESLLACQLKALVGPNKSVSRETDIRFSWQGALQQCVPHLRNERARRQFVKEMREAAIALRQRSVAPENGSAVMFDYITPHALSCKLSENMSAIQKKRLSKKMEWRKRIMLAIFLNNDQ